MTFLCALTTRRFGFPARVRLLRHCLCTQEFENEYEETTYRLTKILCCRSDLQLSIIGKKKYYLTLDKIGRHYTKSGLGLVTGRKDHLHPATMFSSVSNPGEIRYKFVHELHIDDKNNFEVRDNTKTVIRTRSGIELKGRLPDENPSLYDPITLIDHLHDHRIFSVSWDREEEHLMIGFYNGFRMIERKLSEIPVRYVDLLLTINNIIPDVDTGTFGRMDVWFTKTGDQKFSWTAKSKDIHQFPFDTIQPDKWNGFTRELVHHSVALERMLDWMESRSSSSQPVPSSSQPSSSSSRPMPPSLAHSRRPQESSDPTEDIPSMLANPPSTPPRHSTRPPSKEVIDSVLNKLLRADAPRPEMDQTAQELTKLSADAIVLLTKRGSEGVLREKLDEAIGKNVALVMENTSLISKLSEANHKLSEANHELSEANNKIESLTTTTKLQDVSIAQLKNERDQQTRERTGQLERQLDELQDTLKRQKETEKELKDELEVEKDKLIKVWKLYLVTEEERDLLKTRAEKRKAESQQVESEGDLNTPRSKQSKSVANGK
jgi:hypothetical protein